MGLLRRIFAIAMVLTVLTSTAAPGVLQAQACGVRIFGLCENEGYFLGGTVGATGSGLLTTWGGLLASNDVETMIAQIGTYLQGFNCGGNLGGDAGQQRNAASFIVLTMLGYPPRTPADTACGVYGAWANRVREYNNRGLINFNENFSYVYNTRIQRSTLDVAWYGASDTRLSIVFRAPDGSVIYAIKKDCGNPVSGPSGPGVLNPVSTPPTISCANASLTTTPTNPMAGENFRINVGFGAASNGTGGGGTNYSIFVNLPGVDPTVPAVNGAGPPPGGVAAFAQPTFHDTPFGSGTLPNPSRPQPIRFATTGQKGGTFQIHVGGAVGSPITCPFTVNVVARPYHRVYGGDVMAGSGFGTCTGNFSAIVAFNKPVAPYTGAGSQLASFAHNAIIDYASGAADGSQPAGNAQWGNPKRLAFGNFGAGVSGPGIPASATSAPGSTFGGGFSRANLGCAPDYVAARPASAVTIGGAPASMVAFDLNPAVEGTYYRSGNLVINGNGLVGGTADNGNEVSIYVNGNVYIETNIRYRDDAAYTSAADVPTFKLIVSGNVYVHPDVERLDGIYVVQSNATTTGFFVTCGNRAWPGSLPSAGDLARTTTGAGAGCGGRRLKVYGAVVAEQIKLLRTVGSVNQASVSERWGAVNTNPNPGNPAEEFIYTPEMWFGAVNGGAGEYDSVTSLPPVL